MRSSKFVLPMVVMALLAACVPVTPAAGAVQVSDAWVKAFGGMTAAETMPGMPTPEPTRPSDAAHKAPIDTALYMTIHNSGGQADRLLRVQTDVAQKAELHTAQKQGDQMKMVPVAGIDVPAGGQVTLEPGGYHVMLFGLTRDVKEGDSVSITLEFERAGPIAVQAQVRKP